MPGTVVPALAEHDMHLNYLMILVFMACMEMFGSGAGIGILIIQKTHKPIQSVPELAKPRLFVEAHI